jgi:hypothetical protein
MTSKEVGQQLRKVFGRPIPAIISAAMLAWMVVRWSLWDYPLFILVGSLAVWAAVYALWLRKRTPRQPRHLTKLGLLGFAVFGAVIIVCFGFGQVPRGNLLYPKKEWEGWLRGSLLWTMSLTVYYFKFVISSAAKRYFGRAALIWCLNWVLLLDVGFLLTPERSAVNHCWLLIFCAALTAAVDLVVLSEERPRRERMAARQAFFFADFPTLVAFAVILMYAYHERLRVPDAFMAGAVAFQLISAKVIVIAIEALALTHLSNSLPSKLAPVEAV